MTPPIADHGLIGDLQTAALVAADGTVDWFCCPRFDSPSFFAALLDARRGGYCRVRADGPAKQLYFPGTAVLITRFSTEDGIGEVVDFMPPLPDAAAVERHRLVRVLRCVRGSTKFRLDVVPRFDYGRRPHRTHLTAHGAVFVSGDETLTLHAPDLRVDETHDVRAEFTLHEGDEQGVVLEWGGAAPMPVHDVRELFFDTLRWWHSWLGRSTYRGRWREQVERSAITLKLMTYEPTGAVIAAPTAGLPEQLGGERNWDYRFTWVRDASFAVGSLLAAGFTDEAAKFARWLADRYQEHGALRVMYRIDGSTDLDEEMLDHWDGYRGSRPVRVGNAASDQLQLDIHGELLDAVYQADQHGLRVAHRGWQALVEVIDWLTENWRLPDDGIWETRGGRAEFTYGRLMSWVAFDRAIRLAHAHSCPGPVERWRAVRDEIHAEIWDRGWYPERAAFVQRYDDDVLDAALLRMPQVGFVAPRDPQWLSTLAALEDDLVTDGLVLRYDPEASPDGLRGDEGTFSLCTFTYVNALARAGAVTKARLVFEKMLTHGNHLGLYAEEISHTGEQLGNFPQAFTHLALIDAAIALDAAISG